MAGTRLADRLADMDDRYSRQVLFSGIGADGQASLASATALVVGCGALGTVISTILVRAGVGTVKIVDRDFIEFHNLQRQVLFDEEDVRARLPKAVAAQRHLQKVNSAIKVEGIVADVNYSNVEDFVRTADVVLDGLDNLEARLLINDSCLKHNVPWVYGGAIASDGVTMTVVPGKTACFRCAFPSPAARGMALTCDTAGVIAPAPFVIGSLQATQALKILVGSGDVGGRITAVDVWEGFFHNIKIDRRPDCPACNGRWEFLESRFGTRSASLCGQNAVQVMDPSRTSFSLEQLAGQLKALGETDYNGYMLTFLADGYEMVVFPDGRAIVRGTSDQTIARSLYSKYIGS